MISNILRYFKQIMAMAVVLAVFASSSVMALTPAQRKVIDSGAGDFFNTEQNTGCQSSSTAGFASAGGKVYILGDSITVGSTAELQKAMPSAGFSIQKINGVVGRSITTPGEGTETGLQAITNDQANITAASVIVIALGTNGASESDVRTMMDNLKDASGKVYWVNVFSPAVSSKDTFNQSLVNLSSTAGFDVIDANAANIEVGADNIHPTAAGHAAFAQVIASSISGGSKTATASGCTCSTGGSGNGGDRDARYRAVWGYLTSGKGLSPEAAAGLMGNLEAESGIDPHNMQNNAPLPDGPEFPTEGNPPAPHSSIKDKFGYGLAQWTSGGRQQNLINYAIENNRSSGDMGLQLDFLWKELGESYTGVLATLQTPGVSLEEASDEVLLRFEIPASVLGGEAEKQRSMEARRGLGRNIFNEFSGQSIGMTVGGGCNTAGANIDLENPDTTGIQCPANTPDAGTADGYRDGKLRKIRLCSVGGTRVNSQIAGSIAQLLSDAQSVGLGLDSGGGSFRDMEGQIAIYNKWCSDAGKSPTPPPYPKEKWSDYVRCPGGAPPGYSNHQMGLGFDFVCRGKLIAQSYAAGQGSPCFQWLAANAAKYGLYEFGKGESRNSAGYEAWHWSVDGN